MYDLIVVGLGPGAYSTGIYATRYNLNTLLIGEVHGGLMGLTHRVDNYPGLPELSGLEIADKMRDHYLSLNGNIKFGTIVNIVKKDNYFELQTNTNEILQSKSVVIATGTVRRKLNIIGEDKFFGRGVSYCATCDANFFKNKIVAVIGGGDTAFISSLHLKQFANKVYLIHRRDEFRAQPALINEAKKEGIEFILNANVKEIKGKLKVESMLLDVNGKESELKIEGLFIEIGNVPVTSFLKDLNIEFDEQKYIKVNNDASTNIEGLFAVGDCTNGMNNFKQIITAAGMGAVAAESIYVYLKKLK